MIESRTRKKMVDVARELFAQRGKKNVTMNDIAEASSKGRRTLYTYFKSKDEIYKAVIQEEVNLLYEQVEAVFDKNLSPQKTLTEYIVTHLDAVKRAVTRNGSLRSDFFRDIYEVERVRRKIDVKEIALIRGLLEKGVRSGDFKRMNIEMSALVIFYALKGVEVPYIRQGLSVDFDSNKRTVVDFVLRSIERR